MANEKMMSQMSSKPGFIAALDQSGGSTPGALRLYGIPDSAYSGDAEMFKLIHEMRVRIMTAPAFTGANKSTPGKFSVIMLLTALQPPPPTPNTVIRGFSSLMSGGVRLSAMVASRLRARWFATADGRGDW